MLQVLRNRKTHDVCIVGSGAGGGMAAKVLTEAGANVVMLEAGPMWDTVSGFWTTKMGIDDLQYIGNMFVPEWKGCPDEALTKLGLTPLPE